MMSTKHVWIVGLLVVGCGHTAQVEVAHAPTDSMEVERQYADAIDEAFELYEAEVTAALDPIYESDEEAEAVARTYTGLRFDAHLDVALARRGLTEGDLGRYALSHPQFAESLREAHAGKLQALEQAAADIALRCELIEIYDEIEGLEEEEVTFD
jgi:hypothetical protein